MLRRTFVKLVASSILVPTVQLRQEIDRERILRLFCDDEGYHTKYNLQRPFGHGSLTYATDAKHIVRAEIANRVEDGECCKPPVEFVWQVHWKPAAEFVPFELPPLTALSGNDGDVCPVCDNRRIFFGKYYPTYEESGGFDREWCASHPDYDVDTNTYRDPTCYWCRGGKVKFSDSCVINGVLMCYSRLKAIAAIPDVSVAGAGDAIVFRGSGFEGISMGQHRRK